jgi:hypothetical protein
MKRFKLFTVMLRRGNGFAPSVCGCHSWRAKTFICKEHRVAVGPATCYVTGNSSGRGEGAEASS